MNATSLLISCREGEPAALDEFVRRCQPVVERLALTILDDGRPDPLPAVRAVVQETLVAALGALETFHDDSEFTPWLVALGLKSCRKHLRRSSPDQPAAITLPVTGQRPTLQSAVQSLEEDLRLPLLLYYSNGLSIAQVAWVLKLNQNTVMARMMAGREKLRHLF